MLWQPCPRSAVPASATNVSNIPTSDACDCAPLHPDASKVPAVRKGGDASIYQRKVLQRNAQIKVVDALMKYPNLSLELWGTVGNMLKNAKEQAADSAEEWSTQYRKFQKLPTYWMTSWLMTHSKGRLTQDDLELVREKRGEAFLREVFLFTTQTDPGDNLPVAARNKHVCGVMFNMRAGAVGKRLDHLLDRIAFVASQDLTWMDFGPYEVVWQKNVAVKIKHLSGGDAVIDNDGRFDDSFTWHDCYSDMGAMVKGTRVSKFWLNAYFDKPNGPHATRATDSILRDLAAKAQEHIQKRVEAIDADKVKDDPTLLPDEGLLRKQEALTKARVMLANKRMKLEQGHSFIKPEAKEELEDGEAYGLRECPT